jgi:hypothetical protein
MWRSLIVPARFIDWVSLTKDHPFAPLPFGAEKEEILLMLRCNITLPSLLSGRVRFVVRRKGAGHVRI